MTPPKQHVVTPADSRVYIGECTRCRGTGDDGGFLGCDMCYGRLIVETIWPMDDETRAVLARDPDGVAEAERLAWLLIDAARKITTTVMFGLAWRILNPSETWRRRDDLFVRADGATVAAIRALGYEVEGPLEGRLVLVAAQS